MKNCTFKNLVANQKTWNNFLKKEWLLYFCVVLPFDKYFFHFLPSWFISQDRNSGSSRSLYNHYI